VLRCVHEKGGERVSKEPTRLEIIKALESIEGDLWAGETADALSAVRNLLRRLGVEVKDDW